MTGARYAVLVGTSRSSDPDLPALRCPAQDVEKVAELLSHTDCGEFERVVRLIDQPSWEIFRELARVLTKAGPEDLVLIYFSGHGKLDGTHTLHLATSDTDLEILDASSLPVRRLGDLATNSRAKSVVLILDCCYAGRGGKDFTQAKGTLKDQLELLSGEGRFVLTAASDFQPAQEKESDQFSVFTKHLVRGLERGEADLNQDGFITLDELFRFARRETKKESRQDPRIWAADKGEEVIIAKSGLEARRERARRVEAKLYELRADGRVTYDIVAEGVTIANKEVTDLTFDEVRKDKTLSLLLTESSSPTQSVEFLRNWLVPTAGKAVPDPVYVRDSAEDRSDPILPSAQLEEETGPDTSFTSWLRENRTRRVVVLPSLGLASALSLLAVGLIANTSSLAASQFFSWGAWFQALLISCLLVSIPSGYVDGVVAPRGSVALRRFRISWQFVWVAWSLLFALLGVRHSLQGYIVEWGASIPADSILNVVNNAQTVALFYCYLTVSRETVAYNRKISIRRRFDWRIGAAVLALVGCVDLALATSGLTTGAEMLDWTSALASAIAMGLLVGRFDSKFIGAPTPVIALLYLYVATQSLWPVANQSVRLAAILFSVALLFKCLFFALVAWCLDSGVLLFYFERISGVYRRVEDDRKHFLITSLVRPCRENAPAQPWAGRRSDIRRIDHGCFAIPYGPQLWCRL